MTTTKFCMYCRTLVLAVDLVVTGSGDPAHGECHFEAIEDLRQFEHDRWADQMFA